MIYCDIVGKITLDSFGTLTTIKSQTEHGKVWFIGKEIQDIIKFKDLSQAIKQANLNKNETVLLTKIKYGKFFDDLRDTIQLTSKFSNSITLISKEGLIKLIANSEKIVDKESVIKELGIENPIILKTIKEIDFGLILTEYCKNLKIKLLHQYSIDGFLIDFYLPELKIGIEFDELYHNTKKQVEKDNIRKKTIESNNIKIIRINEKSYNLGYIFSEITKCYTKNQLL